MDVAVNNIKINNSCYIVTDSKYLRNHQVVRVINNRLGFILFFFSFKRQNVMS